MNTYYFECTVSFTDFVPEEDTYYGEEYYCGIVEGINYEDGRLNAEKCGLELFKSDLGEFLDDVKITLDKFYETSEDARAS